jgi:septal ring factor EnvC (AmiA/AmiB activator)
MADDRSIRSPAQRIRVRTWIAVGGVCFVTLTLIASVGVIVRYAQDSSALLKRALEQANREISEPVNKATRRVEQQLERANQEASTRKAELERLAKAKALAAEQVDRGNRSLSSLQAQQETVARELESRQRKLSALTQGRPQVLGVTPVPHSPEETTEGQKISQLSSQLEQLQLSIDQQLARQQQVGASVKTTDPDLAKAREQVARSTMESEAWASVLSQLMATKPPPQTGRPVPTPADSNDKQALAEEKWVPFWTAVVAAVGAVFAACVGASVAAWATTTKREELNRRDEELRLARESRL